MINDIAKLIKECSNIAILPHISADGDSIGSSLALAISLRSMSKCVDIISEEAIPENYMFLPDSNTIKVYNGEMSDYDLIIALDSGDIERLGKRGIFISKTVKTVNIDHHPTNTNFAIYNYIKSDASSVGEIIYCLLKEYDFFINADIATCLYTAIIADTGGFKYSNTTSQTHLIAAELIDYDLDISDISRRVFDVLTLGKLKLINIATGSIDIIEDGKISILSINDDILESIGAKEEDYDGIINFARNINTVEVAVTFRKKINGEIKVNFRSNRYVDVAKIAQKYGGGGHVRAAGVTFREGYDLVKEKIIKDIIDEL